MKRNYSGRSGVVNSASDGEQGFWPSYADMMSAVALILFFLMLISYIQNLITGNDLQNTQEVLASTEAKLALTVSQVEDAEEELALISLDLDEAKLTLSEQEQSIEEQLLLLAQQEALIAQQKDYILAADEELHEMQGQMQAIAVLRLSILEQIRDSIVDVMGDSSKVSIGENGSIILSEGVLFDFASSEVKDESRPVLEQLSRVFTEFLSDSENAKYVDSIVISGHTDNVGSDSGNRGLSTDRANSVLNYLMSVNGGKLSDYSEYFCAAGYGSTRPVSSNSTEAGRAENRRIEISMILKDETVLDIVESYLALELPEAELSTEASNN